MWWTCPKGHDYRARIDKVTLGLKCPVCNSRRLTPGENDLATVEPTLCLEYHPYLNDKQADEIVPSDHRLWWRCLANKHKHAQTVQNRRESKGCPMCPPADRIMARKHLAIRGGSSAAATTHRR